MENIPHEVLQQGGFVGPRFTGVFLYRDVFWRVAVPIVFGTTQVNLLDALRIMPAEIKRELTRRPDQMREYLMLWADCYDYDTGYQRSKSVVSQGSFVDEMIESTERELNSAVSDLCQQRPNSKARHCARDATEKALKAFLADRVGLTDSEARTRFGHDLVKLSAEVARQARRRLWLKFRIISTSLLLTLIVTLRNPTRAPNSGVPTDSRNPWQQKSSEPSPASTNSPESSPIRSSAPRVLTLLHLSPEGRSRLGKAPYLNTDSKSVADFIG